MIIVTGSAGFIGSHCAEHFSRQHKARLILVDDPAFFRERSSYFDACTASLWDWATGQEGKPTTHKIIDRAYFTKVLEKIGPEHVPVNKAAKENLLIPAGERIEGVIHLGACTDTAEQRKDYLEQWNVEYTKQIWRWCTKHKIPLVYASSGATYGAGENGFSDSWETALKLKPLNPYGQSKQDFDLWAHEQTETPPHWYGLKFFNVYGPHEGHKGPMASAVLHAYRQIVRSGTCRLFRSHDPRVKDGEQSRDFIHVSDIVSLVDHFYVNRPANGLYNCGTGKARTFHDLMAAIFATLERPLKIDWIDTPEQYRKAYQYFTEAEMNHTLASGYKAPFLSLEDGVAQYVKWLVKNERPEQTFH
ncbi:MAG: ADP-glyceromanno-heptose 6-epimerase [Bdellovibrionota bacterium]